MSSRLPATHSNGADGWKRCHTISQTHTHTYTHTHRFAFCSWFFLVGHWDSVNGIRSHFHTPMQKAEGRLWCLCGSCRVRFPNFALPFCTWTCSPQYEYLVSAQRSLSFPSGMCVCFFSFHLVTRFSKSGISPHFGLWVLSVAFVSCW